MFNNTKIFVKSVQRRRDNTNGLTFPQKKIWSARIVR